MVSLYFGSSCERLQRRVAFDVGTSPHGLSAGLPMSVQETGEAPDIHLTVDGVPPGGGIPPTVRVFLPVSHFLQAAY